jgi:hypothetical protein
LFGLFEDGVRDGEDNSRRRRRENRARQSSRGFGAASQSGREQDRETRGYGREDHEAGIENCRESRTKSRTKSRSESCAQAGHGEAGRSGEEDCGREVRAREDRRAGSKGRESRSEGACETAR